MNEAVWTSLYGRLSAGTALIGALGGTAIFRNQAPDGQALPYVVYSWQGGGPQHNTAHQDANGLIYIRAYAARASQAGSISALVLTLLDRNPLSPTGWTNFGLMADGHVEMPYTDESGTTYASGDTYRILLDKN